MYVCSSVRTADGVTIAVYHGEIFTSYTSFAHRQTRVAHVNRFGATHLGVRNSYHSTYLQPLYFSALSASFDALETGVYTLCNPFFQLDDSEMSIVPFPVNPNLGICSIIHR